METPTRGILDQISPQKVMPKPTGTDTSPPLQPLSSYFTPAPTDNVYTLPSFRNTPGDLYPNAARTPATGGSTPRPPSTPGILNAVAPPIPQPPAPYTANQATSKDASAVGYTPEGFKVDKPQTVQGQIDDIIRKDSPLMQQADTRARQKANARGGINSSLYAGTAQNEVMAAALPIAQQDASTFNQANTNTVNAKNAALNFKAGADNDTSKLNAQLGTNVSLANADSANKALEQAFQAKANYGLAALDTNTKMALANLDANTKLQLTQMENQNRQALQANQDAASMFNQVTTAIANISQNPNLTKEAKDAAIASQLATLKEGLRLQGDVAGLDLGGYFTQGGGNLSGATSFSNLPLRTDIPNGGHRDAQGNVYNADGSQAGWRGPEGGDTYIGPNGTLYTDVNAWSQAVNGGGGTRPTGTTPAPATPRPGTSTPAPTGSVPTGTVTNPSAPPNQNPGTVQPVTLAGWKPGMPPPPGYKLTNRGQLVKA